MTAASGTPDPPGIWRRLLSDGCQPLRAAAARCDPTRPADVARLRREHDAEPALVAAALSLAAARDKARAKFPDLADTLLATPEAVEQASSLAVARHKAARFREAGVQPVLDLCCGMGGDMLGLIAEGVEVIGVDRDPLRAWMAAQNTGRPTAAADASDIDARGRAVHIDPARRGRRGRAFRIADYQPGPDTINALVRHAACTAVKLSPGVDLDELAATIPVPGEAQFISEGGSLVQAVLWTGPLATAERSATLITDTGAHTLAGAPSEAPVGSEALGAWLHTVDPAAERAGLLHVLCERHGLGLPHPKLGLLSGERRIDDPWLTPFELIEQMPWRPRRVKRWLRDHDGGLIEVKTRGKAVDPDRAQTELRGDGATPFTLFVLRWDTRVLALITRRC